MMHIRWLLTTAMLPCGSTCQLDYLNFHKKKNCDLKCKLANCNAPKKTKVFFKAAVNEIWYVFLVLQSVSQRQRAETERRQ